MPIPWGKQRFEDVVEMVHFAERLERCRIRGQFQKYMRISIPLLRSNVIFRCWIDGCGLRGAIKGWWLRLLLWPGDGVGDLIRDGGTVDRKSVIHGGFGVID